MGGVRGALRRSLRAAKIIVIGIDPAITGELPEERPACSGRGSVEPDGHRSVTA